MIKKIPTLKRSINHINVYKSQESKKKLVLKD